MKNRTHSKIMTMILALAMTLSMGTAVFAVDTPTSGGPRDHAPAKHLSSNSFTIEKDIVLFNVDTSQIYEPNITYTYQVDPVTVPANTKITGLTNDSDNKTDDAAKETVTVSVRSGIAGGVTLTGNKSSAAGATADVVFGTGTTKENSNKEGATVTIDSNHVDENLTINIVPATIYNNGANPAGVYRYKLTDVTTADTLTEAGVDRDADYNESIYLDVYLRNNADNNGLEVYGYVLHKGGDDLTLAYKEGSTEVSKISGYDLESETKESGTRKTIISDQYHTFNVEVSKTTTGGMADKTNNFPFKVDLSNGTVKSEADFYYVAKQDGAAGTATDGALSTSGAWTLGTLAATGSAISFQNGDNILITGLPKGTSINVAEFNNTTDTYTLSAKDTDDADMTLDNNDISKAIDPNGNGGLKAAFAVDNTAAKDTVAFTNTLNEVSPTNVVMRFAPYLFILGGAIMLLFASRRRRSEEE